MVACAAAAVLVAGAGSADGRAAAHAHHRPSVATGSADVTGPTTATISGAVDPRGQETEYQFDYGTTTSYGSSTPARDAGAGTSAQAASASLTGLEPDTSYHYRIEATNHSGTAYGADATFTTAAALPPGVGTAAAVAIANHTAILQADVNPNGQPTTYQFQFGTTTAYGQAVPLTPASAGSSTSPVPVSDAVSGLAADTTYHYRIAATNPSGTSYGQDATFTTGQVNYILQIITAGDARGVITSSPAGILCPATCSAGYLAGTLVTLTPSVQPGSAFAGWSGACSGTGPCSVAMGATTTVTATFERSVPPGCAPVRRSVGVLLSAPPASGLTGAARRRARQEERRVDHLVLGVRCRHAARLEVRPTILVYEPGRARHATQTRLRAVTARLAGDGRLKLDVRLSRRVLRALRAGRRVELHLVLDASGVLAGEHEVAMIRIWPKQA